MVCVSVRAPACAWKRHVNISAGRDQLAVFVRESEVNVGHLDVPNRIGGAVVGGGGFDLHHGIGPALISDVDAGTLDFEVAVGFRRFGSGEQFLAGDDWFPLVGETQLVQFLSHPVAL